jgi:hypothetical protein
MFARLGGGHAHHAEERREGPTESAAFRCPALHGFEIPEQPGSIAVGDREPVRHRRLQPARCGPAPAAGPKIGQVKGEHVSRNGATHGDRPSEAVPPRLGEHAGLLLSRCRLAGEIPRRVKGTDDHGVSRIDDKHRFVGRVEHIRRRFRRGLELVDRHVLLSLGDSRNCMQLLISHRFRQRSGFAGERSSSSPLRRSRYAWCFAPRYSTNTALSVE